jgi:hypothetical protein
MRLVKFLVFVASFASIPSLFAQQAPPKAPQTARQALIEMFNGKVDISKHLTIEVQKEFQKKSGSGFAFTPGAMLAGFHSQAGSRLEMFETGPILLSSTDAKSHERTEVHVDNDDLNAEEDTLLLSIHQFRDEKEIDTPYQFLSQISIGMKKQENIWRLNEIALGAKFPVGDPALFRKLNEQTQAAGIDVAGTGTSDGIYGAKLGSAEASQIPKRDIQMTLSLISFQEEAYASRHPEQGFSCSLPDLLATVGESGAFGLDPQVKTGIFDGFRINVTGCQGIPAGSYQITAEPLSPSAGNKAFCTDATHNIRQSDDGRAATCLASGRVPARTQESNADAGHLAR